MLFKAKNQKTFEFSLIINNISNASFKEIFIMNKILFLIHLAFLFTIFSCATIPKPDIDLPSQAAERGNIKFIAKRASEL